MLTRADYKKLGIPYYDQSAESEKIEVIASSLSSRLNTLRAIVPFVVEVPKDSQSEGTPGELAVDNEFFYICTEKNSWKRIPLKEI